MRTVCAVELFAGGGGLAEGLQRAGVRPIAAVESDDYAASVFEANHPQIRMFRRDVKQFGADELSSIVPPSGIDILAACPPCQGFSTLTAKYQREDDRNALVAEIGRIAAELNPRAIMVENVPGLARRGQPLLDALLLDLQAQGYVTNWSVLQVADYGVPQKRRRLVLLAGRGFRIEMPAPTHSANGRGGLPPWRSLRDAIGEKGPAHRIDEAEARGGFAAVNWHIVRKLGAPNLARLKHAIPGKGRGKLPTKIRPACHRASDAGFVNSYGRMDWDQPSSTITAGCLSPSKGRFGHPDQLRTISLREAALIQTFPRNYKLGSEGIDRACSVVGNALPCYFAEAIAAQVARTLLRAEAWLD